MHKMFKRKRTFLNFSVTLLHLLNYWPNEQHEKYTKFRLLKDLSLILSLLPCALPILADFCLQLYEGVNNLTALTENLIALNCIAGMIYTVICFIKKRHLIKELVNRINNFRNFCDTQNIILVDEKANLYSKMFLLYGILGNVVYMLMPQLNVANCRLNRSKHMIEEGIPCGLVTRCRFPFKFDYTPIFEIVFIHQIYTCTMVTIVILCVMMLLCGFLIHIVHQLSCLRILLRNLHSIIDIYGFKTLHYCIQYHIQIIRYAEDTNEAFSRMMLLHLTLTSVVISILCFEIIMVDNITDSVRFAFHLLGWLILLLLICHYCQKLIDESIYISDEIYNGHWAESCVRARKELLLILMRSQRPLTLSAANMGAMSLPTFLRVMSSAYSFFTLLLKLKS